MTQTMPFGKHRGKRIDEIPNDYLKWLIRECKNIPYNLEEAVVVSLTYPDAKSYIARTTEVFNIPVNHTIAALIKEALGKKWKESGVLPILADALEDAGFRDTTDLDILGRLRGVKEIDIYLFVEALGRYEEQQRIALKYEKEMRDAESICGDRSGE